MAFKIFLAVIVVLALLTAIGANVQENKRLAVAIVALIVLAVVFLQGDSRAAPEVGHITADQIGKGVYSE